MPLHPSYQKTVLDWMMVGLVASTPAQRWVQWATASPTSQSTFDGPFSPRCTVSFAAANSPSGSATNLNALSCTATAVATALGWNLYNANVGGTRIAYGTFTDLGMACASGDVGSIAAGLLKITVA